MKRISEVEKSLDIIRTSIKKMYPGDVHIMLMSGIEMELKELFQNGIDIGYKDGVADIEQKHKVELNPTEFPYYGE